MAKKIERPNMGRVEEWLTYRMAPSVALASKARSEFTRNGYTGRAKCLAIAAVVLGALSGQLRLHVGGMWTTALSGQPYITGGRLLTPRQALLDMVPDWLVIEHVPSRTESGRLAVHCQVKVRTWHPGFWLYVARQLYKQGSIEVRVKFSVRRRDRVQDQVQTYAREELDLGRGER